MITRIFIILLLVVSVSCTKKIEEKASGETSSNAKTEVFYTCSMHPQIKQKDPGKCPICGMGLSKIEIEHDEDHSAHNNQDKEARGDIYFCESNPEITSEAPGECPIDGTPMLKESAAESNQIVAKVKLRKSQVNHFKADLFSVTTMKMSRNIRLLGSVIKSEDKESNIPARVPGRIEEVLVDSTGSFVRKGDPVLKLYSPKLITGGEEYLIAIKNYKSNPRNREFKDLVEQSAERLKLWGVLDSQLKVWSKSKKIPREITIYSPVTGIVLKKNAIEGKYFKEGQSFFDLVDLASLWVELDVYESDSALVRLGQNVKLEFIAYPGEVWEGSIDFINPVLDQKTRTLKIRTTLKNKEGKLRPGMVGTATVALELDGMPLVIPRSAIIDTGKRKVVWVHVGNNKYQAQKVHTGFESEGYVEIKHGLTEGEKVVIDGNFLLDAQAQLFGGYQDTKASGGHQH